VEAIVGIESVEQGVKTASDEGQPRERAEEVDARKGDAARRAIEKARETNQVQFGQDRSQLVYSISPIVTGKRRR
jgi:hypothetical protein